MRALDTNTTIRYLVNDNKEQANSVRKILIAAEEQGQPLFIPMLVVLEMIWVLDSSYGFSRQDILGALESLNNLSAVQIENRDALVIFLNSAKKIPGDLADLLIGACALYAGCEAVLTFDKKAAKTPFFELIGN